MTLLDIEGTKFSDNYTLGFDASCDEFLKVCRQVLRDHPQAMVFPAHQPEKLLWGYVFYWQESGNDTCFYPLFCIVNLDTCNVLDLVFKKLLEEDCTGMKLIKWLREL